MSPDEQLAQCDREIAQCAAYDGPDLIGAAMGWADNMIEKELILQQEYAEFLSQKSVRFTPVGFDVAREAINPQLFDFQKDIVAWACKRGRSALFEDCGLGKTPQQLEWAKFVSAYTRKPVLIFAPLAVSQQTHHEGIKFHIPVTVCKSQSDIRDGVNITNYEKMAHFTPDVLGGVVLDESSILKGFDGKTRKALTEFCKTIPYRLACTATPAPNDYMELGNHAEFLGVMTCSEMLSLFFVHDGGDTSKWRLKRHAESEFWKWICSWAVALRAPSDLGYSDGKFKLPALHMEQITVESTDNPFGTLFTCEAKTMDERRQARRSSLSQRVQACADLVNSIREPWIIWCDLNAESEALADAIEDAIEVTGSDSAEFKEAAVEWFTGQRCVCGDPVFRSKLAACGRKSIKTTESEESPAIQSMPPVSKDIDHPEPQKKTRRTCETTTPPIGTNSNGQRSSKISSMPGGGRGTQLTQPIAIRLKCPRSDGRPITPINGTISGCENTASPLLNTTESLKSNTEAALFVDGQTPETQHMFGSMLTTATQPVSSVGFCVQTATPELESSKTIQTDSTRHPCTCGHASGVRRLVSKSSIFGFGLNLQHCRRVAFVGLSDSYEQFYQAIRRCWRFGQSREVHCYVITSDAEGAVVRNIERKEQQSKALMDGMVGHMQEQTRKEVRGMEKETSNYETKTVKTERWTAIQGDCVEHVAQIPEGSIDYTIFSPPFASLYTYSNSDRDMGNSKDFDEFSRHFDFLAPMLYRVLRPGRLLSFHCMNLPMTKERDGVIALRDFRGELIRVFERAGFVFHSEVCIWKDPVTAMQRTKAIGLLYKQLKKDSVISRQGIPDYLVTMRKDGINTAPVTKTPEYFPVSLWQNYASPVWMDINPSDTLSRDGARDDEDERHICPLQLEVIRRAIRLWTNPDDLILSPFMGIGSEGYEALRAGRRFIGTELKQSYFDQAVANLQYAEKSADSQGGLFE